MYTGRWLDLKIQEDQGDNQVCLMLWAVLKRSMQRFEAEELKMLQGFKRLVSLTTILMCATVR